MLLTIGFFVGVIAGILIGIILFGSDVNPMDCERRVETFDRPLTDRPLPAEPRRRPHAKRKPRDPKTL